jgi:hypothetical protein
VVFYFMTADRGFQPVKNGYLKLNFFRAGKVQRITAVVLFENKPVQKVFERLRLRLKQAGDSESL